MDNGRHPLPVAIEEILFCNMGFGPDLQVVERFCPEPAEQGTFGGVADDNDLSFAFLEMCRPVHCGIERDPFRRSYRDDPGTDGFSGRVMPRLPSGFW